MESKLNNAWKYLVPSPRRAFQQLVVKGTKLPAWSLYCDYIAESDPMTPEQIAEGYDIPLEAVHEAIAYCRSNPQDIEADIKREEAWFVAQGLSNGGSQTPRRAVN